MSGDMCLPGLFRLNIDTSKIGRILQDLIPSIYQINMKFQILLPPYNNMQ